MRNISEMDIIQIDVTNICNKSCSNCTRMCGHYAEKKLYFMDVDYYERAVKSLKNFPGMIGMIGGEPTLHPRFRDLCEVLRSHIPQKKRRGLWSNGSNKYAEYRPLIEETFGFKNVNDHVTNEIIHTPLLVSSQDMVDRGHLSEQEWQEYTGACWVQNNWSATINPAGAYFCEVAGMLDYLFEGNNGWDIDAPTEWWRKTISEYSRQAAWACRKCGCQLPLPPRRSTEVIDDVSDSSLERLLSVNSPKAKRGQYCLYTGGLDYSQKRDNTWYWNKKAPIEFLKKIVGRLLAGKSAGRP